MCVKEHLLFTLTYLGMLGTGTEMSKSKKSKKATSQRASPLGLVPQKV